MGLRAGLDAIGKTKTSFPYRESNPDPSLAILPEVVAFLLVNVYVLTIIQIIIIPQNVDPQRLTTV
jgi:hypothetical protein